MKYSLVFFIFFAVISTSIFAIDFGLVLNTAGEYAPNSGEEGSNFSGSVTPWVSSVLGGKVNFYLSGKVTFEYEYDGEGWTWPPLVELERTELSFRPVQTVYLVLGRQWFKDNRGMIASGLFDGLLGSFGFGRMRLTGGVFYTGFLYKETAEILMTQGDLEYYQMPLDYGNPTSYFASRRVFAAVAGEFPDLTSRTSLVLSALAQFDLNSYEGVPALHSQYLETSLGLEAADTLRFTLTGIGALAEAAGAGTKINIAAALEADWELPGRLMDIFSAELYWGSGAVNDTIGPFKPVSGIAQGTVFTPTLPGLMNSRASYTVRLHRTLSFSTRAISFWRTDLETFTDRELDLGSKDRFLGWELYGQFIWAPQSALRFNAGGGVFFPSGAFVEGTGLRWKINAGLIVSL
jgi:hypothetical protein